MKLRLASPRSALLSTLFRRETRQNLRLIAQRTVALGMAALLLPLAQIDALAQQQWPQKPSPYPNQYGQSNPYAQPDPNYIPQQPAYPSQPGYPNQPNYPAQPYSQQQYPQQAPGQQDYAAQGDYPGQYGEGQPAAPGQQPDQGFASQQLEQLVAPIALYPDQLIAQILAASTYPAQVIAADHWLQSMGSVPPDQVAAAADAQSTWDPSVKALTAFPQVLAMLDRDLQWTTDLGNAYYNQPQDVLSTIQVLRQRAENAGTLRNTPQQEVTSDQGYIQLAPTNPQVVYVPTYNPWYAYGAPINPYPGFCFVDAFGHAIADVGLGIVFGTGIVLGAFFHAAFGWLGWGLNWHGGGVYYNHAPYYSHSTSVARWGGFHGGYGGGYRGGSNYGGAGSRFGRPMPEGRGFGGASAGNYRGESGYGRASNGYASQQFGRDNGGRTFGNSGSSYPRPTYPGSESYGGNRAQGFAGNRAENYAYARPSEPMRQQYSTPQPYGRSQAYSNPGYSSPQQQYGRAQSYSNPGFNGGGYRNQQSFANQRSYSAPVSRGFQQSAPRYEAPGSSRSYGGGDGRSYSAPKAPSYHQPAAPKWNGGGGGHSGGGGGLFHHSDGGGKHH
jgi:hypothetical protein